MNLPKLEMDSAKRNVKCSSSYNKTRQEFESYVWTDDSSPVNLIMCDPTSAPSRSFVDSIRAGSEFGTDIEEKETPEFAQFANSVLVPRCYVIIFLLFYTCHEW